MEVIVIGGKHLFAVHEQLTSIRDTSFSYCSHENPDLADIIGMGNNEMELQDLSEVMVNVIVTDSDPTNQCSSFCIDAIISLSNSHLQHFGVCHGHCAKGFALVFGTLINSPSDSWPICNPQISPASVASLTAKPLVIEE